PQRRLRSRLSIFPRARPAAAPAGGHALGRRAADARRGARAHVAPAPAPARRARARAGAPRHARDLPHRADPPQVARPERLAGGGEGVDGPRARRSRLPARDGTRGHVGPVVRPEPRRLDPSLLSRVLAMNLDGRALRRTKAMWGSGAASHRTNVVGGAGGGVPVCTCSINVVGGSGGGAAPRPPRTG